MLYRNRFASILFAFKFGMLYQRVRFQKFAEPFPQCTRSVPVDDADPWLIRQRRLIQKFIHLLTSLLHGESNHIDLSRSPTFVRLRAHRNIFPAPGRDNRLSLGIAFYSRDLIHRHLHPQRPGFNFRRTSVNTPQNYRLRKTSHPHLRSRLQTLRTNLPHTLRLDAQILLRIRKRLHHRRVQLFLRLAARVLHLPPRHLFHLRAQLAVLHRGNHAGHVFLEPLLHLRELLFQLRDPLLLPLHPVRAQFSPLVLQHALLLRHLLLHAVQFVAAAVQICNQVPRLVCPIISFVSPSRCAIAIPLEPPGTPTISRYVGRKFTSSNPTAAFTIPGVFAAYVFSRS